MKKQIITLIVLFPLLGTGGLYAQTDLKAAFEKGMDAFDKDPVNAVKNMDDNLRFVGGHNGSLNNKTQVLAIAARSQGGKNTTQMSDLKVKQSGTLGVVSGIRNHALTLENNAKMTWKDAFTYTFEWKNNAWVITDMQHTKIDYQSMPNVDEMAVKKVLETENKAYHEANVPLWKAQWADASYTERQHGSLNERIKAPYLKGEALKKGHDEYGKAHKPTGMVSVVSDYEVHVSGNIAWATYTQEDKKADGSVAQKQRGLRILERINNEWKIVMMGLHPW